MNETKKWTVKTGSTGGIGSEVAELVATSGQNLVLVNRSPKKGQKQREKILSSHPNLSVETVSADFMDSHSISRAIAAVNRLPGRIDSLYNVAGVLSASDLPDFFGPLLSRAQHSVWPFRAVIE